MTDAVLNKPEGGVWDFDIAEDGDVLVSDFFDTAILVQLKEEKRASSSEVERPENRRGWIGNDPAFERGSKIWLYEQSRLTRTVINKIIAAANESLGEFVKRGFALKVFTELTDVIFQQGAVFLRAQIQRPNGEVTIALVKLWDNSGITTGL